MYNKLNYHKMKSGKIRFLHTEKELPNTLVRLGLKCNEKCLFCNVCENSDDKNGLKYVLSVVNSLPAGTRLSLSGGEPTVYDWLPGVIEYAAKRGIQTELQTNGIVLADEKKVAELKRAGLNYAFVSLHSHAAIIHDFLTNVKGSFDKCVKAVKNFNKHEIFVSVNPVLTTANYHNLEEYVSFVNDVLSVKVISLSVVQPRGRAENNKVLVPDYSMLGDEVEKALKKAKTLGIKIINPVCGLPLCVGGWQKYLSNCVEYAKGNNDIPFTEGKVKPKKCVECVLSKYCAGVWEEYLALYGDVALKPVNKIPKFYE